MTKRGPESLSMLAGTVSAIGASACCALPLVLVSLGVGGAWVSQLRALERFFPMFVACAVGAFGFGFYRLYIRRCEPDAACAVPKTQRRQRVAFWAALILATGLIAFPYLYG